MKNIKKYTLKSIGLIALMLLNYNILQAQNGESCENPADIEVNNESNSSSINMAGHDYYFSFSPSDSIVYFDITTSNDMPGSL